ncbi:MAG: V-type ATP synthase subunit D [bacterium]
MRINVNPTRMEMQRLKKSLALARRGWKLLKDKQDELMRIFLEKKDEFFKKYHEVTGEMNNVSSLALLGEGFLSEKRAASLAGLSDASVSLSKSTKMLFNIRIPEFQLKQTGECFNYEPAESVVYWDEAVRRVSEMLGRIVFAGVLLFEMQELCREIAATRRRVNSLEYIMIPNLHETIKYINFKLEEMERSNTVRLMKVKDLVRSH